MEADVRRRLRARRLGVQPGGGERCEVCRAAATPTTEAGGEGSRVPPGVAKLSREPSRLMLAWAPPDVAHVELVDGCRTRWAPV